MDTEYTDEEQKSSIFSHRLEMLRELVEAPDEVIEALTTPMERLCSQMPVER